MPEEAVLPIPESDASGDDGDVRALQALDRHRIPVVAETGIGARQDIDGISGVNGIDRRLDGAEVARDIVIFREGCGGREADGQKRQRKMKLGRVQAPPGHDRGERARVHRPWVAAGRHSAPAL